MFDPDSIQDAVKLNTSTRSDDPAPSTKTRQRQLTPAEKDAAYLLRLDKKLELAKNILTDLKKILRPGIYAIELIIPDPDKANLKPEQRKKEKCNLHKKCYHYHKLSEIARIAAEYEGIGNCYITLNPLFEELDGESCPLDSEFIIERHNIYIDIDPVRYDETGSPIIRYESNGKPTPDTTICTMDAEWTEGYETAINIRDYITTLGGPLPALIDSANSGGLIYQVDLPADDNGLVKRFLLTLKKRFETPSVKIDATVSDPKRHVKVPGTRTLKTTCKGRPRRPMRILECPTPRESLPIDLIRTIAGEISDTEVLSLAPVEYGTTTLTTDQILEKARSAKNNTKFGLLYDMGDTSNYPSPSEADMALLCLLAFWTNKDKDLMDELFRGSALNDDKWETRKDYRTKSIDLAITYTTSTYNPSESTDEPIIDDRAPILMNTDLNMVREEILKLLPKITTIYQKGDHLVTFHKIDQDTTDIFRGLTGSYATHLLGESTFTCNLTKYAHFYRNKVNIKGEFQREESCLPDRTVIKAILEQGSYKGVRPLRTIVEAPYLNPDGSLSAPGYNEVTRTIYVPTCEIEPLPESPTAQDAKEAADRLLHIVREFPFKSDHDRAAWLAGTLTDIARPMIMGPVPGTAIIGNKAGVGKGMLVHVATIISTGRKCPATSYPLDNEEATKIKVTLALGGVNRIMLDNLEEGSAYGNGPLDSAITEPTIRDRILGINSDTGEITLCLAWWLTGNAIVPVKDAWRRWLVCNLITTLEHPEEREVEEENLLDNVAENRATHLRDCLIILRAYQILSGPRKKTLRSWKPLGSFYEWDRIIRGAIYYGTELDCSTTRKEAAAQAPQHLNKLVLLDEIEKIQATQSQYKNGITVNDLLSLADHQANPLAPYTHMDLRRALLAYSNNGALPSDIRTGKLLRTLTNDPLESKMLIAIPGRKTLWSVITAPQTTKATQISKTAQRDQGLQE